MDSAGFDATRWDHWLVISCFIAVAAFGLWFSWQFRQTAKKRRRQQQLRSRVARRLALELGLPDVPGVDLARSLSQPIALRQATARSPEKSATQSMGRRYRADK